jgi:hypothetical protein
MKPSVTVTAGVQPLTVPQVSGWLAGHAITKMSHIAFTTAIQPPWLTAEANKAITCLQPYTQHMRANT